MSAADHTVSDGDSVVQDRRGKRRTSERGLAGWRRPTTWSAWAAELVIFEADDHVGGLASGFREPGWDWSVERFYHHWFASDRHMLGLIEELGWSGRVRFPRPYTVVYHEGRFYPFRSIPRHCSSRGSGGE